MRSAPPQEILVRGFGAWRTGVCILAVLAGSSIAGWAAAGASPAATIAALALISLATARALRVAPFALTWDGTRWWLAQPAGAAPSEVRLQVTLDLGAWMVLRLEGEGRSGTRWLPVTAREAGPAWRAWRAALFEGRGRIDG